MLVMGVALEKFLFSVPPTAHISAVPDFTGTEGNRYGNEEERRWLEGADGLS